MGVYYIDYENVKNKGLNGISKLYKNDVVKIFYSKDAETITFGLHRRIMESQAQFEYHRVDNSIKSSLKNALDVLLLNDLSETIKQNKSDKYYIVSKDSDYDGFIENKRNQKINICKIDEICKCSDENQTNRKTIPTKRVNNDNLSLNGKEQRFRSFFGRNLKSYEDNKEEIVQAYMKAKSKQELNNLLQQTFYSDGVHDILDIMSEFIKDLPGRS